MSNSTNASQMNFTELEAFFSNNKKREKKEQKEPVKKLLSSQLRVSRRPQAFDIQF